MTRRCTLYCHHHLNCKIYNVCIFYIPESFFEIDLERESGALKEFKCITNYSKQMVTKTNMCVSTTETSITAILTMFMERGEYSGHCYQPSVNHRELDVALFLHEHLNDKGVMQRSMVHSHLVDEPDESFGLITPISFCPYEVRNDSGGVAIRSHGSLIGREGTSDAGVQSTSFLNGRTAYHISGKAFSRTLALFGHKWVAPDGTSRDESVPPTIDELMEFLELFRGHGLSTKERFVSFLRAFDLERIYEYNAGVGVWYNIRYLSEVMRALTPFRLSVIDGQHRAVLMALFTCGYFNPSNEVILDGSTTLADALGDRSGGLGWDDAQVWCQTKTCIGFAVDEEGVIVDDLSASQAVLRKYGEVLTKAQAQSITFSWVQLYRDLIGILGRAENNLPFDHASGAKRLGFDFWSQSAEKPPSAKGKKGTVSSNWYIYEQRLASVFDELVKYTEDNKTAAAFLFDHPLQKDVSSSWKEATRGLFTSGGKLLILTDRRCTDAINMVLNLLKLFAFEPDLYQKLRLITEIPDVLFAQHRDDVMTYTSGFRSPWWLQTFILGTAKANQEIFLAKLLTERKILEALRARTITAELSKLLAQDNPDFACLDVRIPLDIGLMKASKLGIKHQRGVTLMSKIMYAFSQTIILDILETIGRYGYAPDLLTLGMAPDDCQNYTWYLK